MAAAAHLFVFSYDVERDSARARIARLLEKHMRRVQKSVFEARMTEALSKRLARRAAIHLAPTDSLRVYCVTQDGLAASHVVGMPPLAEASAFLLL